LDELSRQRYLRQLIIPGFGEEAQRKLSDATVFIAGAGGLGSSAALYLAAAGVGCLRICDDDVVELSNLNRQILHNESRLGRNKADSAAETLRELNPSIRIEPLAVRITPENIGELAGRALFLVDCLDNVATRYILNRFAWKKGLPLVHGGINGMAGQVTVLVPGKTPCMQCLFPEEPPRGTIPVLGAAPGVIGSLLAMETIKMITGFGEPLLGRLFFWDGMTQEARTIAWKGIPDCPVCGGGPPGPMKP
jgi:adenylyltransferase/sulfurtransferase